MFAGVGLSVCVCLVWCILGGGTMTSPPPLESSAPSSSCGLFKGNNNPIIVDGKNKNEHFGLVPWHAALYYRMDKEGSVFWQMKCGGSLISKWFILTAAHCLNNHLVDDVSHLRIALGKYNQSWDVIEPTEQRRNVSAISIPEQYSRATFVFDIGLVMLSESIKFNEYIMPVCFDKNLGMNNLLGSNLYAVSWEKTQDGNRSDLLVFNTMTAMSQGDCNKNVPSIYPIFEKFCSMTNNSESLGGPTGVGLTTTDSDGLHHIVGIYSLKVTRNYFSLFTNVSWPFHKNWMKSEIRRLEIQHVLD